MTQSTGNTKKYISLAVRLAVVTAGIIFAYRWISKDVGWENLANVFEKMNILIFILAAALFLIAQFIVALRWRFLLHSQSIHIDLNAAFRLHFLGLFYNNFMPSSIGGDLVRAWYVTKHTEKKFEAALSVFVDRIVGLLSSLIIAVFFYFLFIKTEGKTIEFTRKGGDGFKNVLQYKTQLFYALIILLAVITILAIIKPTRAILLKFISKVCDGFKKTTEKFKNAITIYCSKPLTIITVFAMTVFLQMLVITGFWFLGKNLGIQASIKYYYVFFTLTWVLGAIPISIGGAVVVEGTLVYLFTKVAGVDNNLALALALCQRIVWMIVSLPGGLIHMLGAHLPKDISVDYQENVD